MKLPDMAPYVALTRMQIQHVRSAKPDGLVAALPPASLVPLALWGDAALLPMRVTSQLFRAVGGASARSK